MNSSKRFDPSRRSLLIGGMASVGMISIPRLGFSASPSFRFEGAEDRTLVLIELAGGNDGLSTIVPKGDDAYHAARTVTRVDPATTHALDDYRGFHPELKSFKSLWDRGELAIIEGVGYPNPNRSHFMSQEIWGTASEKGKLAGDGWVSRLVSARFKERNPTRAIHMGGKVPDFMLSSDHPVLCMESPSSYRIASGEAELTKVANAGMMASGPRKSRAEEMREKLKSVLNDAQASSVDVRATVGRYKPTVEYPNSDLGEALMVAAAMINGGTGTRVVSVTLPGFDTHANQKEAHDRLWNNVDQSLGAFLADMRNSSRNKDTLAMVFSEFGRRVAENASRGTDHGAAAPMFLCGAPVKGGLYGKHPSLTDLYDGDLIHTNDFRQTYATVVRDWFGVDHRAVLGGDWSPLPLLNA